MAKKKSNIGQTYDRAIRYAGQTPRKTLKAKRNQWAVIRESYKQSRPNEKAPTVYDYARAYKQQAEQGQSLPPEAYETSAQQDIPTIDFAQQYLENFFSRLHEIRQDTYDYIDNNKEGTHESGKLASIGQYRVDEMERVYQAIRDEVAKMIKEYGKDAVARAMANNVELDYSIAITLLPPSDIYIVFNQTLEQLLALTSQMEVEAQRLAEQMESDYYGV